MLVLGGNFILHSLGRQELNPPRVCPSPSSLSPVSGLRFSNKRIFPFSNLSDFCIFLSPNSCSLPVLSPSSPFPPSLAPKTPSHYFPLSINLLLPFFTPKKILIIPNFPL